MSHGAQIVAKLFVDFSFHTVGRDGAEVVQIGDILFGIFLRLAWKLSVVKLDYQDMYIHLFFMHNFHTFIFQELINIVAFLKILNEVKTTSKGTTSGYSLVVVFTPKIPPAWWDYFYLNILNSLLIPSAKTDESYYANSI